MSQKIGVITFHRANNLGAVLQAYALFEYLNENICQTEVIDYYPNNSIPAKNTFLRKALRVGKKTICGKKQKNRYRRFGKFKEFINLLHVSPQAYYGDEAIEAAPPQYDLLISGSDQILNTTLTGNSKAYYLDFAQNTPKISYASSFGRMEISDCEREYIHSYLKDFRSLSAREESGKEIMEQELGQKVELVVDPVFLLSKEEWENLTTPMHEEKYIFVYAMESTSWLVEAIEQVRNDYNLPIKIVLGGNFQLPVEGTVDSCCGPQEFLSYIKNAECVVTNSFHGTAFSIIFEKKFVCVAHSCKNTRLENLCKMAGSLDQMVTNSNTKYIIGKSEIDGSYAQRKIIDSVTLSKEYLQNNVRSFLKKDIVSAMDADDCCGCETCMQVCPKNAILLENKEEGFLYPKVDYGKCVQCGLCSIKCPSLNRVDGSMPIQVFAVRHSDANIVQNSTSGGAFTALSDYILKNGGLIFGAALCDEFNCRHIQANNVADRNRMRGAKYVQSYMGNSFLKVKEGLLKNKQVLFSGTPCQIAGLRNYLGNKNTDNLILVDIVCHGVPSPQVFKDHIQWLEKQHGKVKQYIFRSKDIGWHGLNVKVTYADGAKEIDTIRTNVYSRLYFNSLITRKSCYGCKYASMERVGDITISDFWTIDKCSTRFNDEKGTSCVYLNTEKGRKLFEQVISDVDVETHSFEESMQPNLNKPTCPSEDRDLFWNDYRAHGFDYCAKKYTQGHFYYEFRRILKSINRRIHG